MSPGQLISVIDDDQSVRESIPDLLTEFGFRVHVFSSTEDFLRSAVVAETQGLVLDVGTEGARGPSLAEELAQRGLRIPIVFITGDVDERAREQLIGAGAVEVLFKPFSDAALLAAVKTAASIGRTSWSP